MPPLAVLPTEARFLPFHSHDVDSGRAFIVFRVYVIARIFSKDIFLRGEASARQDV